MKNRTLPFILMGMLLLLLACRLTQPSNQPSAGVPPTRTPHATFTPTSTRQPDPIAIAPTLTETTAPQNDLPPSPEASATPTVLPTETPSPQPAATATTAPQPTATPQPPAPTSTPPPPPTNTPVPQPAGPATGQFGISGKVIARDKTTFAAGEKAFFTYEATNHTDAPVSFGLLGIKASNGNFNTSWINPDSILPGVPFRHDDGLTFDAPGTYQVFLAICYSNCGGANAVWEEYPSGAVTITVQ